ncbi:MAG: HAMP domain-containing histidine kinase [Planctomycetes bacterium]|nr:HAMP domain-containing histidine kinase [Planctomycetota bacterium]
MLFTKTIRRKTYLGLLLVLAMLITLAAGAISGLMSYRRLVRELNFSINDAPRRADLADAVGSLFEPLLVPPPASDAEAQRQHEKFRRTLADARSRIVDFHRKLDQLPPSKSEKARRPATELILGQMDEQLTELEKQTRTPGDPLHRDEDTDRMLKQVGRLQSLAQQVPDYDDGLNESLAAARDVYRSRFKLIFWATGFCLLLFGCLGYYVRTHILVPLRVLHQGARRVAQGDFDYRVELARGDDMAELADSFNKMTERFLEVKRDLNRQVRERCKQLVRSERLAGIGFLAAGIAHEINNPLSAIVMASDSLVDRMNDDGENAAEDDAEVRRMYLEMIQREASRCQLFTHKLLDFARGKEGERSRCNLVSLVSEVLEMVRLLSQYQDREYVFLRTEPCTVDVNGPEIKQVILNLVANSLESMDDGGTLNIRISEQMDEVVLIFEDDGCGMSEETVDNIFEPFFTRRRGGKGTGLGLAICQRIISDHAGTIEATSAGPGQGSTFRVRLPRRQTTEAEIAA